MSLPNSVASRPQVIDPECLNAGDIALFRMRAPRLLQQRIEKTQLGIASAAHAKWTHAAVVGTGYRIAEMKGKGFSLGYLYEYDLATVEVTLRRMHGVSEEGRHEIYVNAMDLGRRFPDYGYVDLIGLLLARNDRGRAATLLWPSRGLVCSALCAKAIASVGYDIADGIDYRLVTPSDLSLAHRFDVIAPTTVTGSQLEDWWLDRRPRTWETA